MGGNLLMILGRIKTTKKKFTSSQILFSTLFVSDLTFGVVQIPSKIYLLWKSSEPTCFEVQLSSFSMSFPICISFNLLCIISIERYVYVVYNGFYTRIVTKKGGPYLYSPVFKVLFLIESQCYPYTSLSHTCFQFSLTFNVSQFIFTPLFTLGVYILIATILSTSQRNCLIPFMLCIRYHAEKYLEPSQTSMMVFFAKQYSNSFSPLIILQKNSIKDV